MSPVNFAKFLRTPFLTEHLWVAAFISSNDVYGIFEFLKEKNLCIF